MSYFKPFKVITALIFCTVYDRPAYGRPAYRRFTLLLMFTLSPLLSCQEEEVAPSISVQLEECLGSVNEECQATLNQKLYASNPAGCLMLKIGEEEPQLLNFLWRASSIELLDVPQGTLQPQQEIQSHLYLFDPAQSPDCEDLPFDFNQSCDQITGCLLKLSSPVMTYEGGELQIDFQGENGVCNLTKNTSSFPREDQDGQDDDCDGVIDENLGGGSCLVGVGICEREGQLITNSNICDIMPGIPTTELCHDFLDNDCDGRLDEGFEDYDRPCDVIDSDQRLTGKWRCDASLLSLVCVDVSNDEDDQCNGLNEDNDQYVDEGYIPTYVECVDSCVSTGYLVCVEGNLESTCIDEAIDQNAPDECDGIDSDCDGRLDEDAGGQSAEMTCGIGACKVQASITCEQGQLTTTCEADEPGESEVICNGVDDDCDGVEDEGNRFLDDVLHCGGCDVKCDLPNAEPQCVMGVCVYECAPGFSDDLNTPQRDCQCQIQPSELCDGEDNDCDGEVDEDIPLQICGCDTPPARCVEGRFMCDYDVEVCDMEDNDCDGEIDEGGDCSRLFKSTCWSKIQHTIKKMGPDIVGVASTEDLSSPLNFEYQPMIYSNRFPSFLPKHDDKYKIEFSCNTETDWDDWIESNCGLTMYWSDFDITDPWTCQATLADQTFERNIHCIQSWDNMNREKVIDLQDGPSRLNLALVCDPDPSVDEQLRALFLNSLSVELAVIQRDSVAEANCQSITTSFSANMCNPADHYFCSVDRILRQYPHARTQTVTEINNDQYPCTQIAIGQF